MLKFYFKILITEKEVKLNYKHLTKEERYHIQAYKSAGYTNKKIAEDLNVHPATISRELKRNCTTQLQIYTATKADKVSNNRKRYASKISNRKIDKKTKLMIKKYIKMDFSPEQTSEILKIRENIKISTTTIYQFIEEDKQRNGTLYTHLRHYHTGHRRAKYGTKNKNRIKGRVSISKRPDIVNKKGRLGDWEIDTIIGTNRKGAITTVVERVSMLVKISIPTSKKAKEIERETKRILKPLKDKVITITSDNGLEFANHRNTSNALDCDWYFCHPYSSWERGLNEQVNGLIRQYIPKGTSFQNILKKDIKRIENILNNRPRKLLNWKTPNEVFYAQKINEKIAA